ncbi:MAG: hypothetical protein Q8P45_03670 [Candidatus Harrisonbacteria bacterium]|nr:hypothetical protein [Candidatus Harrisonbacteria bacterium]
MLEPGQIEPDEASYGQVMESFHDAGKRWRHSPQLDMVVGVSFNGSPLTGRLADVCLRARQPETAQPIPQDRLTQLASELERRRRAKYWAVLGSPRHWR